jgi:hypothetical protein
MDGVNRIAPSSNTLLVHCCLLHALFLPVFPVFPVLPVFPVFPILPVLPALP